MPDDKHPKVKEILFVRMVRDPIFTFKLSEYASIQELFDTIERHEALGMLDGKAPWFLGLLEDKDGMYEYLGISYEIFDTKEMRSGLDILTQDNYNGKEKA